MGDDNNNCRSVACAGGKQEGSCGGHNPRDFHGFKVNCDMEAKPKATSVDMCASYCRDQKGCKTFSYGTVSGCRWSACDDTAAKDRSGKCSAGGGYGGSAQCGTESHRDDSLYELVD